MDGRGRDVRGQTEAGLALERQPTVRRRLILSSNMDRERRLTRHATAGIIRYCVPSWLRFEMAKDLLIPDERIERAIPLIRGQKVMLDRDLAKLYGVGTGVLNQAVKRNLLRFPQDFMFQLSKEETEIWKSQIVISNPAAKMAVRKRPYAFTEHGVDVHAREYFAKKKDRDSS